MQVIKSNGSRQDFDESKIDGHVQYACDGLNVDPKLLRDNVALAFYDGMTTKEIAKGLIVAAGHLISPEAPDYTYVAARLVLQSVYKQVTGGGIEYPHLQTTLHKGVGYNRIDGALVDGRFDLEALNDAIKSGRDLSFNYLGIQTVADRYLLRTPAKIGKQGDIFEPPQHFFMRVAMGLAVREENPTERAIEFYEQLSTLDYLSSTPTLFNAGTPFAQLSSCYGPYVPDDLEGIFELGFKEAGMLSKFAGGIGSSWTALRAAGSPIHSTNGMSSGPVPFLKIYNDVAVAVNQGGKRKGAFAPYLEVWHADVEDFIDLKKKTGDERRRTYDIFPAIWACDLFFDRVRADADFSLFCPHECPELLGKFGQEFNEAYEAAERAGKARKVVKAMDLWRKWLDALFRTGNPWVTFKDECNRRNPQDHVGFIHNSNLCTEITLNNGIDETFVCNLGSVNLSKHMTADGKIDLPKLRKTVRTAIRMLDNVIDINYYPTENSRRSNMRHRPIGLGMMGYAEALIQAGIDWESEEHLRFADELTEHFSFYAIEASCDLAPERGSYETFEGSKWSRGILPIDTARDQSSVLGDKWRFLAERIRQVGIRNSNIMAIAPTATIANIAGTTECVQSIVDHVTVKENLSGSFKVINPLHKYGRPELVKTMFEIDPVWAIRAAGKRQKWIDQSQSLNVYKRANHMGRDMSSWYLLAQELGVKTTYYLKNQKEGTESAKIEQPTRVQPDEYECEACQ